jgi:hypothetical protein
MRRLQISTIFTQAEVQLIACLTGHPERLKISGYICRCTNSFLHIIFVRTAGPFCDCRSFVLSITDSFVGGEHRRALNEKA